jgi:hypothetical protein
MTVSDSESWLRLTLATLSDVLAPRDREFLGRAMREYGRLWAAEASKAVE